MTQAHVPYQVGVEQVQEDERKTIGEICTAFDTILETTAEDYGHAVRWVHAKAHGPLDGELTVDADLRSELAEGLFAQAGTHKILIRLSTNAGDVLPCAVSLTRGLAIKVLDVPGERLPGAEGTAQDFVMVNGKVFQAKTADQFLGDLKLLANATGKVEGTKKVVSAVIRGVHNGLEALGIESAAIHSMGSAWNVEPLGAMPHALSSPVWPSLSGGRFAPLSCASRVDNYPNSNASRVDSAN